MELSHAEHTRKKTVSVSVREKITAFHDRHLRTAPVSEHIVAAFGDISQNLQSARGKEWAARLAPNMDRLAKNAEIAGAAADFVLATVIGGVGIKKYLDVRASAASLQRRMSMLKEGTAGALRREGQALKKIASRKRSAGVLLGAGLGTLAVRPVTRLLDAGATFGLPLTKRVALTVDSILLRRETANTPKQVFVGSGRA